MELAYSFYFFLPLLSLLPGLSPILSQCPYGRYQEGRAERSGSTHRAPAKRALLGVTPADDARAACVQGVGAGGGV